MSSKTVTSSKKLPKKCHKNHDDDLLRSQLLQRFRIIVNNDGGDCLFKALAQLRFGENFERKHRIIRTVVMDKMESKSIPFNISDYVEDDEDVSDYFERLRFKGEHGGEAEILTAALLFERTIIVHDAHHGAPLVYPSHKSLRRYIAIDAETYHLFRTTSRDVGRYEAMMEHKIPEDEQSQR